EHAAGECTRAAHALRVGGPEDGDVAAADRELARRRELRPFDADDGAMQREPRAALDRADTRPVARERDRLPAVLPDLRARCDDQVGAPFAPRLPTSVAATKAASDGE